MHFICMFTQMKWLFHSVIVLQIIKSPLPQFDETIPGRVSSRDGRPGNASRDGLVKLWEGAFYYLQYYYTVK